jgi:hypothetical protein
MPAAAAAAAVSAARQLQRRHRDKLGFVLLALRSYDHSQHTCGASRKPKAPNTTPPMTKPARKLESLLRLSALRHKLQNTHNHQTQEGKQLLDA